MNFGESNQFKHRSSFAQKILLEDVKLLQINQKIIQDIEVNKIHTKSEYFNPQFFNTQDFFPKNMEKEDDGQNLCNIKNHPNISKYKNDGNKKLNMIDLIITKQSPLSLNVLYDDNQLDIKNYDIKENNFIKGVSSITRQGQVRSNNDDRITILINVSKPENIYTNKWPFCCFFGIYDGHNGSSCAEFLKGNLHNFV